MTDTRDLTKTVDILQKYLLNTAAALRNEENIQSLDFSGKFAKEADLLDAALQRIVTNRQYSEEVARRFRSDARNMAALELINDWVGAVARDLVDARRNRLYRLTCASSEAAGMGRSDGVLSAIVLQYIQRVLRDGRT